MYTVREFLCTCMYRVGVLVFILCTCLDYKVGEFVCTCVYTKDEFVYRVGVLCVCCVPVGTTLLVGEFVFTCVYRYCVFLCTYVYTV